METTLAKFSPKEGENFVSVSLFPSLWPQKFKYVWAKHFVVGQPASFVRLFAGSWIATRQASLSLAIFRSLPKFMSIESVISSSHLILWHVLLLLPSVFPSIRDICRVSCLHQMTKILEFQLQHQALQWTFRVDFPRTLRSFLQHHNLKASIILHTAFFTSSSHNHTWPLGRP